MHKSIEDLLTPEVAEEMAKYIVDNIGPTNNERALDCDFNISKGKFISKDVNTWFKIDYKGDNESIKEIYKSIRKDEIYNPEERLHLFDKWKNMIAVLIETKYKDKVAKKIRKHLLGDIPKKIMPIEKIRVDFLEITEKPDHDYLLSIKKLVNANSVDVASKRLAETAFEVAEKTYEDPIDVIWRLKEEGDERFQCVQDVEKRKHFFEIELDMWVDYSLVSKEKVEKFV